RTGVAVGHRSVEVGRRPVGDDDDPGGIETVDVEQAAPGGVALDDGHRRHLEDAVQNAPLVGGRIPEGRVQAGDQRDLQLVDEADDVGAVRSSVDAVLVL